MSILITNLIIFIMLLGVIMVIYFTKKNKKCDSCCSTTKTLHSKFISKKWSLTGNSKNLWTITIGAVMSDKPLHYPVSFVDSKDVLPLHSGEAIFLHGHPNVFQLNLRHNIATDENTIMKTIMKTWICFLPCITGGSDSFTSIIVSAKDDFYKYDGSEHIWTVVE
jgi:hypothetical protein